MPHSYTSEYPANVPVETGIKPFFEAFYQRSDIPGEHEKYADFFTNNATVFVGSRNAVGREEILQLREDMWKTVAVRLHTPRKIFPFGTGADEIMLYGIVDYTFKDKREASLEWAARAKLVKEGDNWKMDFYRVYMDTASAR